MTNLELQKVAVKIRKGIIKSTHAAKAGHPGGALYSAEVFAYLYYEELNVNPQDPENEDRDRFVLSKGHSAPGLYSVLAMKGFFPEEDLLTLRHIGSHLQGHPTLKITPGIDMSSGSLGQGASASLGMAMAARMDNKSYRVYALLGDGEIQEGQVWEAAMFAGARKLDNVCWIIDNNNLQIDGTLEEVKGFSAIADISAIAAQDYILTPGRYVGIEEQEDDGEPFEEKMGRLTSELSDMFAKSHELEDEIRRKLGAIGYEV